MSVSTPVTETETPPRRPRRLGCLLTVLVFVGLLVAGAVGLLFSPLADVQRIEVIGMHRLTLDQVETRLGFEPGTPLIRLDFDSAGEALEELTWFADASFERDLGGVVTVRIAEQRPVALALHGSGEWVVVSHEGRVLSEPLQNPPRLPQVIGIAAASAVGSYLEEEALPLLAVTDVLTASRVAHGQLWRDDRSEIWVELGSGNRVALGNDSELAAKLAALMTLLTELDIDPSSRVTDPAELDVSVPHLPVVRGG